MVHRCLDLIDLSMRSSVAISVCAAGMGLGTFAGYFLHTEIGNMLIAKISSQIAEAELARKEASFATLKARDTSTEQHGRRFADKLYGRWCYDCNKEKVIADYKYQLLELECKKQSCTVEFDAVLMNAGTAIDISSFTASLSNNEKEIVAIQSDKQWDSVRISNIRAE